MHWWIVVGKSYIRCLKALRHRKHHWLRLLVGGRAMQILKVVCAGLSRSFQFIKSSKQCLYIRCIDLRQRDRLLPIYVASIVRADISGDGLALSIAFLKVWYCTDSIMAFNGKESRHPKKGRGRSRSWECERRVLCGVPHVVNASGLRWLQKIMNRMARSEHGWSLADTPALARSVAVAWYAHLHHFCN